MENQPLLSIIIPVYNEEARLRRCLCSIAQQTYQNLEIIVVDDGSFDNSGNIADEFAEADHRFRVLHTSNKGQGIARNQGMEIANGMYLGFVDADDYIDPRMYEMLTERLLDTGAEIVQCGICSVKEDGDVIQERPGLQGIVDIEDIGVFFQQYFSSATFSYECCNKLYSMNFLKDHGLKFYSNDQVCYEDLLFLMEAVKSLKRVAGLEEVLYFYTYLPESHSHSLKEWKPGKILNMFQIIENEIGTGESKLFYLELHSLALLQVCQVLYRMLNHTKGRQLMRRLFRTEQIKKYLKSMSDPLSPSIRRKVARGLKYLPYPIKYIFLYQYFRKNYLW